MPDTIDPIALTETAPTETAPTETAPTETAPVPRPPQPCGRCATPTQHRRYVHTSGTTDTRRSLWCAGCATTHAARCGVCTAIVAGASRVRVTTSQYGDTRTMCIVCADRGVTAGQLRWDADEHGAVGLFSSSMYTTLIRDIDAPAVAVTVRLGTIGSIASCYGHVGRWPGAPTNRVPESAMVHTHDGYGVCRACLATLPTCPECERRTGDVARYTQLGPHPRQAVCASCHEIRRQAASAGEISVAEYHSTARAGYRPQGRPTTTPRPRTRYNPTPVDGIRFGVELEVCVDRAHENTVAACIKAQLGVLFAGVERDGSVAGFESPTQPGCIDTHRRVWSGFKKPEYASTNSTCGLHVHMSRGAMTTAQIARIGYMLNHHADAALWDRFFRRAPTPYCARNPKPFAFFAAGGQREKYSIVNNSPSRTIEIRQPAGTLNGKTIAATVEMLWCLYLYTSPGQPGAAYTRAGGLSWSGLIRWITTDPMARAESKFVRPYLQRRGLLARAEKPTDDTGDGTGDGPTYVAPGTEFAPNWDTFRAYIAVGATSSDPDPDGLDDMDIDDAGPDGTIAF